MIERGYPNSSEDLYIPDNHLYGNSGPILSFDMVKLNLQMEAIPAFPYMANYKIKWEKDDIGFEIQRNC